MAYRVPRRFILPPEEPPPYGLVVLSFFSHTCFLLMAAVISSYISHAEQSKIYIVNLVPSVSAPVAAPTPRAEQPAPPKEVSKPAPPTPKARPEPPPVKRAEPRPRPEPRSRPEPPPPREIPKPAKTEPENPFRRAEVTLPRQVEKATPALRTPPRPERLPERTPLPPRPSPRPPVRPPESPRVAPPETAPAAPLVAARPAVAPVRLGQPKVGPASTGSISLDVSDFPFTYYLRQIQAKISERWAPPRAAVAGGERAVVLFEIGRDGRINEPAVERSSGNALYDQSALRAIADASPFPPLPPEFKAPSLRVHFGFEFRPEQG